MVQIEENKMQVESACHFTNKDKQKISHVMVKSAKKGWETKRSKKQKMIDKL
jgi:hypothetical protein